MDRLAFPGMLVAFAIVSLVPPAKGQSDQERMQGAWTTVSVQRGGRMIEGTAGVVVFSRDRMVMKNRERLGRPIIVQLDPAKSPKQIDFVIKSPFGQQSMRGIYQLTGDTLIICRVARGDRPREFKSSAAAMLLTFQRAKQPITLKPEQLRIAFPARNKNLKPGDVAAVCAEDAEFSRDGKVVARLPLGARIKVLKVTEDSVFGEAPVNGMTTAGSVLRKEVTSAPRAGSG